MAYNRLSNTTAVASFSKTDLDNYIKVQEQHVKHASKALTGQFYSGYMQQVGAGLVAILWASVPIVAGVTVLAGGFSMFYQDKTAAELESFKKETDNALAYLRKIQTNWEHKVGSIFSNNIVSVKLNIPIIRYYDTVSQRTQNYAATEGVYMMSATTSSGIVIES